MAERVTNLVLKEKLENLKEYLIERNNKQDKLIALQTEKTEKNTVAIAGIKGVAIGISAVVTFVLNAGYFLLTKLKS